MSNPLDFRIETNPSSPETVVSGRVDVASIRREQIIDAAMHIITEHGIEKISLSEIENHTGLKRGQLTYYFPAPTKEGILLATFDKILRMMFERNGEKNQRPANFEAMSAWQKLSWFVPMILGHAHDRNFQALQYTFLAQLPHREDFRAKLAWLYEHWRSAIARDLDSEAAKNQGEPIAGFRPRTVASLVQAMIHGFNVQLSTDPNAFDRDEMAALVLWLLAPLFGAAPVPTHSVVPTPVHAAEPIERKRGKRDE